MLSEKNDENAVQKVIENEQLVNRLRRIGFGILIVGLLSAIAVFIFASTANNADGNVVAYENIGGVSYPVDASSSKGYQYNVERVGGKSTLLAVELDDWFASLWHGKKLSYTLAFLSICSALGCFLLARLFSLPPHEDEVDNQDWKG
ncbi:hypothetical protein [Solimicrobium silvestre]|uniref:Uncharacterized protein n=1 Tax=Solimicrobium silvestre TaxID=2099400 RepID=A0A2S9H293_9BURK|nr:hypothetical protein [Solimicrobium silvestre]PRC94099.1 hypothetical protein S2091_1272 [Solimicrobium silvestre]